MLDTVEWTVTEPGLLNLVGTKVCIRFNWRKSRLFGVEIDGVEFGISSDLEGAKLRAFQWIDLMQQMGHEIP